MQEMSFLYDMSFLISKVHQIYLIPYFIIISTEQKKYRMQQDLGPYEISIEAIISEVEKLDWTDVASLPEQIPSNAYFTIVPIQKYRTHYHYFRVLMQTQEVSNRGFSLSSLLLMIRSSNYYALAMRKSVFLTQQFNLQELQRQLFFCNCLLNGNPKQYQIWSYKKDLLNIFKNQVSLNQYNSELSFIDYLLEHDSKNYHAWDYRLWLVCHFGQEKFQLQWTYAVLFQPKQTAYLQQQLDSNFQVTAIDWSNCYSLWSYRYNLRKSINQKIQIKIQKQQQTVQLELISKWISETENQSNQCAWNYIVGLALSQSLKTKQFLEKLAELSLNLYKGTNRFAAGAYLQIWQVLADQYEVILDGRKQILTEMIDKDPVRKQYYVYLLEDDRG